jgi:hypothetical protein
MNTNMYMYVCIDCKKTKRKSEKREKKRKMEATASLCLFTPTIFLLVPPLLSFLGGEAPFLRYGYADNICIIGARERTNDNRAYFFVAFLAGARTHTHTLCMVVCFLFSFRRSSSLSLYHRKKLMH